MKNFKQYLRLWLERVRAIRTEHLGELFEVKPYLEGVPYWLGAVVVGVVAVFYSTAFSEAIDLARALFRSHPYLLFISSPLCFVLVPGLSKDLPQRRVALACHR